MADAGELGKLPPELRKEIYSYLLVEPKKINILRLEVRGVGKVARFNHHRNDKHRGKFYERDSKTWLDAPPSFTSLLYVNKSVASEAVEVLYGVNKFEFLHAGPLLCFLRHIGPSSQYLRYISLIGEGVLYNLHWDALDLAMELLAQGTSLRTLEISHLAFCGQYDSKSANRKPAVTPETVVQHCKPLLDSLKAKIESQNLSLSIFDLIRVTLPRCVFDQPRRSDHSHARRHTKHIAEMSFGHRQFVTINKVKSQDVTRMQCNCICGGAGGNNRRLVKGVKDEIVKQLELGTEDKQNGKEV